jgi:hypothetical protein
VTPVGGEDEILQVVTKDGQAVHRVMGSPREAGGGCVYHGQGTLGGAPGDRCSST